MRTNKEKSIKKKTILNSYWFLYIETIMVIDDVCIQYSTKFFLTKTHIYLPLVNVQDLVINEVIFGVSSHWIHSFICVHFLFNVRSTGNSYLKIENITMITVSRYLCVTIVVERIPVQTATCRFFVIGKFTFSFSIYYY